MSSSPEMEPLLPAPVRPCGKPHRLPSRPVHVRRLTVASIAFAVVVAGVVWAVSAFIMRDLSETYVSRVLTQAQGEVEDFARMVNDPLAMGEGDEQDAVRAGAGAPIDGEMLLPDPPRLSDDKGNPVDPFAEPSIVGSGERPVETAPTLPRRVPGILQTEGQELKYVLNGELIGRDAVKLINIHYHGGFQRIAFTQKDRRYFDRRLLDEPGTIVERIPVLHRPTSRKVMVWDAEINGEPVKLEAALDMGVLEEGVAELRRRIVPKVAAGAAVFVLLLVIAYLYVLRLLSEARSLEAQASEQALLAQVGMLAAGLAHEIRNPLSAVRMNLQLLEEDLVPQAVEAPVAAAGAAPLRAVGGAPAESPCQPTEMSVPQRLFRSTQREILRLNSLVTNFLAFARPSEPQRAPHVLDALVRDCVELLRPAAASSGACIESDLRSGSEPALFDEAMIKQALMNVLLNAIQALPSGGGRVRVATRRTAHEMQVEVSDGGPGLPEDPEVLFRVFYSTKKGGTGLGLAISRSLVERHGGTLEAGRSQGPDGLGGARFTLSIPLQAAAA